MWDVGCRMCTKVTTPLPPVTTAALNHPAPPGTRNSCRCHNCKRLYCWALFRTKVSLLSLFSFPALHSPRPVGLKAPHSLGLPASRAETNGVGETNAERNRWE